MPPDLSLPHLTAQHQKHTTPEVRALFSRHGIQALVGVDDKAERASRVAWARAVADGHADAPSVPYCCDPVHPAAFEDTAQVVAYLAFGLCEVGHEMR